LTQCLQTFSPPFACQTRVEVSHLEKKNGRTYQYPQSPILPAMLFSNAGLAKLWKSLGDNGLSKMESSDAACRTRFPSALPQIHPIKVQKLKPLPNSVQEKYLFCISYFFCGFAIYKLNPFKTK
jgi:hypothetical protein